MKKNFFEEGNLLIGVSSSVLACDIPNIIIYLQRNICKNIKVIISKNSLQFVTAETIENLTRSKVFIENKSQDGFYAPHLSLTEWADIFLILPATVNIISKSAHGICDDLLSTAIFSSNAPVIFYPSMNESMWNKNSLKRNIEILKNDGFHIKFEKVNGLEVYSGKREVLINPNIKNIRIDIMKILNDFDFSIKQEKINVEK